MHFIHTRLIYHSQCIALYSYQAQSLVFITHAVVHFIHSNLVTSINHSQCCELYSYQAQSLVFIAHGVVHFIHTRFSHQYLSLIVQWTLFIPGLVTSMYHSCCSALYSYLTQSLVFITHAVVHFMHTRLSHKYLSLIVQCTLFIPDLVTRIYHSQCSALYSYQIQSLVFITHGVVHFIYTRLSHQYLSLMVQCTLCVSDLVASIYTSWCGALYSYQTQSLVFIAHGVVHFIHTRLSHQYLSRMVKIIV